MAQAFTEAIGVLPQELRTLLDALSDAQKARITEVRLRTDAPLTLTGETQPLFLTRDGKLTPRCTGEARTVEAKEVEQTFLRACDYSVLRRQTEIRQGYVTLRGGHRMGLGGVCGSEGDFERVTSLALRIRRALPNAADELCARLFSDGVLHSVIVAGPPLSGKTTILRALAEKLADGSCGKPYRVCVADSRREFGALPRCDVLTGFEKAQGMRMALRSLSPEMLLCDEVTTAQEVSALEAGFAAGAACAVSVHASAQTIGSRVPLRRLLETGQFSHVVLLDAAVPGRIRHIYDSREWTG